ncbi:hypothetical protein J3Q64DRAFT_1765230 [Phycomyces blakesleeanus]|uniref:Uncharacterized protein n=2 Tax=Phycomyces blakesleeanus TaxID=4837 RepID=A0A162XGJ5_PHYB8|nr:hypothetical protein PHYBLDRAFT_61203 [Phycomyces blakesleeanus NRRL 1555(-)]OAD74745.1 hypothetical protein PHYBLDRAFT_61203 [Phycomyces blakesleeanus NRRL 1555(-)]|eukprot:XP_018292785.1 hypothetical protein PHYBLDRAFT_61203 [Phycomyces blakesleeanus NRRL 1555(-)]
MDTANQDYLIPITRLSKDTQPMPHKHNCLPSATFQNSIGDPTPEKDTTDVWNLQATPNSPSLASAVSEADYGWLMDIDDTTSLSSCDSNLSNAETASTSTPSLIASPSPQPFNHPYNLRIRGNDSNRHTPEENYPNDIGSGYIHNNNNKKRRRQLSVSSNSTSTYSKRRRGYSRHGRSCVSKPIVIGTPRPVSAGSIRITSEPPRPLSRLVVSCSLVDSDLSEFSVLPHS